MPSHAPCLVLLGRVAEAEGRLAEADAAFRGALELEPDTAEAWIGLGRVAEARGEREEARASYERAVRLSRVDPEGIWRLAALEIESGRPEQARAALSELPQRLARVPEAAARLALAERNAGRLDLARASPPRLAARSIRARPSCCSRGRSARRRRAGGPRRPRGAPQGARGDAQDRERSPCAGARSRRSPGPTSSSRSSWRRRPWPQAPLGGCSRGARAGALGAGRVRRGATLAEEGLAPPPRRLAGGLLFRRAEALAGLGRGEAAARPSRRRAAWPARMPAFEGVGRTRGEAPLRPTRLGSVPRAAARRSCSASLGPRPARPLSVTRPSDDPRGDSTGKIPTNLCVRA